MNSPQTADTEVQFTSTAAAARRSQGDSPSFSGMRMRIKAASIVLLLTVAAAAEPKTIRLKQPEAFPLSIHLTVPEGAQLVPQERDDSPEAILVKMPDDDDAGMVVEVVDPNGVRLWRHDFGYNLSAAPGCSITASFHPTLPAVIIRYHGYKWDGDHKLLFAIKKDTGYEIRQQVAAAPEIAAFLKLQEGYNPEYDYSICPQRCEDHPLVFSCIPWELAKNRSPHPFAQDLRWIDITAKLDKNFVITPISATVSHR